MRSPSMRRTPLLRFVSGSELLRECGMGLWEDAEARRAAADQSTWQAGDERTAAARTEQDALGEYVAAMSRLSVSPVEFELHSEWQHPARSDLIGGGIRAIGQNVSGWAIARQSTSVGGGHLVVTADVRLIETSKQASPPKKKMFSAPVAMPVRFAELPYNGGSDFFYSIDGSLQFGRVYHDIDRDMRSSFRHADQYNRRFFDQLDIQPVYTQLVDVLRFSLSTQMR